MRDPRDGVYKLLDVNPRIWGWYTLCARAGIDFTYLLWLMIHGQNIPQVSARQGVRWVRTSADLPIAILEMLKGRLSPRAYIQSLRGPIESAIYSNDDPIPGLLELPILAYKKGIRIWNGQPI